MNAARRGGAWKTFPYPDAAYEFTGAKLKAHWPRLHQGDAEPFPDKSSVAELLRECDDDGDAQKQSVEVQQAWRMYHKGEFEQAATLGASLGPAGACVANKATMIYAHYLEPNAARRLQLLKQVAERAQQASEALPRNANFYYMRAYALGRYSQGYSVLKALAEGIGTQVKECLDAALKYQPKHADAHIGIGTWHAEIINKVGRLVGGLTYGANADAAVAHYRKAIALNPQSAIARIEYADGLLKLFGDDRRKEAERLYWEAAAVEPAEAMERLDMQLAKSRLDQED